MTQINNPEPPWMHDYSICVQFAADNPGGSGGAKSSSSGPALPTTHGRGRPALISFTGIACDNPPQPGRAPGTAVAAAADAMSRPVPG